MEIIQSLIHQQFLTTQKKPFYIYDHNLLCNSIKRIRTLFPKSKDLFFSVKSNPNRQIITEMHQLGLGFDVSSLNELEIVLALNVSQDRITFSGPAKTDETIKKLKSLRLRSIHLDSLEEYHLLKDQGLNLSLRIPLEDSFSQKLGIPFKDLEQLLASKSQLFNGLHIYLGRERAQKTLVHEYLDLILKIFSKYRSSFVDSPQLYWGGGFPSQSFLREEMLPDSQAFQVNIEAGRVVCHEIGLFGTKVLSVKNRSPKHIVINGGLQYMASRHSSPVHGQAGLKNHFISSTNEILPVNENCNANIYGSLGIWNDILSENIHVPAGLKRGDWIITFPTGSYGLSAGVNQFISPDPVEEYYYKNNVLIKLPSMFNISYLESGLHESRKAK